MKIRQSFVANSSSSSFIIIGIRKSITLDEVNPNDGETYEYYEIPELYTNKTGLNCLNLNEDYEDFFVGIKIFESSSIASMTIEEFERRLAEAKQKLEAKGITEYKIYFGERYS